jgi:penicillin-binding protein 1C
MHRLRAVYFSDGQCRSRTFDTGRRPRVAWKTGTSYGFRDAWALGGTRRYTVGVWVGRPDGTPLPGLYGAVTALPLLFEVVDSLPRRRGDAMRPSPPRSVSRQEVCWPLGTAADAQAEALCQQRLEAWILDDVVPPTFAERDARLWGPGLQRFEVDQDSGLRLSADCTSQHRRQSVQIARWPALASPWLSAANRRASRLPSLSPDCRSDGREAIQGLRIDGLNDGATLARAPGSTQGIRLSLRALGTSDDVQWLLDGRWVGVTRGGASLMRAFDGEGEHTLTALADSGDWASVRFRILE